MRVSLVRGAIAASTLIVWSGCSRMSLPPLWHPFAKDRANSESTAASSNAPAPPPVSGVASAPTITMPAVAQGDPRNLPMHPGTSYPTTPYPAVVIPVSVAANAPTYAPNGPPAVTNGGYTPPGQPADPLLASREQVPSYAPASQPYTVPAQNQPYAGAVSGPPSNQTYNAPAQNPPYTPAPGNQAYSVQPQTTPYNGPPAGSYNPSAPSATFTR